MFVNSIGTVPAGTALPAGFAHPHASEEARLIAERGTILRVQVGSGVHGTSIAGQDDRDEMGVCLEPPEFVTGLARVPEPHRAHLRSIRRGERSLTEVLDAITETETRLAELRDSSAVPDQPDRAWVDAWLHRSYVDFWTRG